MQQDLIQVIMYVAPVEQETCQAQGSVMTAKGGTVIRIFWGVETARTYDVKSADPTSTLTTAHNVIMEIVGLMSQPTLLITLVVSVWKDSVHGTTKSARDAGKYIVVNVATNV